MRSPLDFRLVVDQSLSLVVITDAQGRIEYVNPRFTQVTGYQWFEAVGKPIADFGGPQPEESARMWEALTSGREWRGEFEIPTKDGDSRLLSASVSPVKAPDGTITHYVGANLDITDRRRAEAALRESEERFRRLAETTTAATFIFEGPWIRYANAAASKITGYSSEELLGKNFWEIAHPDLETVTRENLHAVAPGEYVPSRSEVGVITKDGQTRWLDFNMGFVETGGKEFVLGTGFDITERKAAEQVLRDSEEKFRRLAETIPVGTVIAQGTRLRFTNSTMEQIFGYSSTELATKQFWELVHPDYRDSVRDRALARQSGKELAPQFEVKFITKSGETRWGLCTANTIEYDGAPAVVGTITDITERKVAEDALRASEEKFRMLADTVPAAITIVQGTAFRFVNSATETITGYAREELLGMDFWETIHPDERQLVMERGLARQEGKEPPSQYEAKLLTRSGEVRWGLITAGAIEYEGAPATVGTMIDITERKAVEKALRASEEKFRALAETHPASTFITQGDRYTFVNKAMQQALGYSEAELLQLNFWSVVHPDFVDLVKERAWARQRGEDVPGEYEIKFVTKGGETRWGLVSAAPIVYEGAPAILGGILDITESKTAEASLRASEEKFRMQAETVPAATFIVQGTRLLFANSTAAAMLGYTREELLGLNFYDFIHPDLQGMAKDRGLARQRGEDVPAQYEIRFVTKAGEERWGIITAARMQYEGEPAIIGSVIDITERKAGEDALHASEERYRMLYEDNPSMYFTLCEGLTVLAVNKYGAEELGYEPEDLIGEPVLGGRSSRETGTVSSAS